MKNLQRFNQELRDELCGNILPFWMNNMLDIHNGGFYGRMTGDGEIVADAPKGAVMNARILWTFSAAYKQIGTAEYLDVAKRAYETLLDKFYDHTNGGVYWSLTADNQPLDTKKQFYALGFAIYGLSEYAHATGDQMALEYAKKLFETIEEHSFDSVDNGYIEAKTDQWDEIADMRLSDKDENEKKTMNTHLHIIEPYTNLYRVWKSDRLRERIVNLIEIFIEKIYSEQTGHFALFFDEKWNERSVGAFSYGHDIEGSWLLLEAALEIGDDALTQRVKACCARLADAAMEGCCDDGSMVYEHHADGRIDADLHWWVQAETVIGLFYKYKYYDDTKALDAALLSWNFIKTKMIDTQSGEWYWSIKADGQINRDDDKAGFWKCPYHNGRMCLEIMRLIEK